MDKKGIIPLIIGFLLGISFWIGDAAYHFGGGRVTGMLDTLLSWLPFLNSTWFLSIVYWVARLAPIIILIVLIIVMKRNKGIDTEQKLNDMDGKLSRLIELNKPVCPNGCNIKQEGTNFCGRCGARLIRK